MDSSNGFRSIMEELACDVSNAAVLLVGKAATVSVDEYRSLNDVDLVVIRSDDRPFERQIEEVGGLSMDMSFISVNDLKDQIAAENTIWLEVASRGKVSHVQEQFAGSISALQEEASSIVSRGPLPVGEEEASFLRYSAGQALADLAKRTDGAVGFDYLAWGLIEDLIEMSFRLGGSWPVKRKKQMDSVERRDPELYSLISEFTGSPDRSVKLEILRKMAEHVLAPIGGTVSTFAKGRYPLCK